MSSSFTYTVLPSGNSDGVRYGGASMCTNHATRSYFGNKVIQVVPANGAIPASQPYFTHLDGRFLAQASGWNRLRGRRRGGGTSNNSNNIGGMPEPLYYIPSGSPSLAVWADTFSPTFGTIGVSPPELATVTYQAKPGDAIGITGDFASNTTFETISQTTGGNLLHTTVTSRRMNDDISVVSVSDSIPDNSAILLYAKNSNGVYSVPKMINKAELWWAASHNIGYNAIIPGDTVSLFGRNLSKASNYVTGSGYDTSSPSTKCDIWLYTSYSGGLRVTCTDINPYRAQFVMPRILPSGTSSTNINFSVLGLTSTLITQSNLLYASGLPVTIYSPTAGYANGTVVSYNNTSLIIDVTSLENGGGGTVNDYVIEPRYDILAYCHNGHGGIYGWSNPIDLHISNYPYLRLNYNRTVVQVPAPSGRNDQIRLQGALNSVGNSGPSTLILQSGTYYIDADIILTTSWGKSVKLMGQGSGITNIALGSGTGLYTSGGDSIITYENLSIFATSGIQIAPQRINNCHIQLSGLNLNCHYIKNSTIIDNTTQLTSNSYVDNCDFYGTRLADQLVFTWGGSNIVFTNNTGQHWRPNGGDEGKVHGRFFVGAPQFQSTLRNHYIAHNTTPTRLHNPQDGFGDGEIFLYDGCNAHLGDTVVSATSTTFTLNSADTDWINKVTAIVVGGKGVGQSRLVTNISGNTYTIDSAWDIIPDTTSKINIVKTVGRVIIYDNQVIGGNILNDGSVQGDSQGVNIFTGSHDVTVDDNRFQDMHFGVSEWAISTVAATSPMLPLYFNVYQNNEFVHCNHGLRTIIDTQVNEDYGMLGNVRRYNIYTSGVLSAWDLLAVSQSGLMDADVWQDCISSGTQYGLYNELAGTYGLNSNFINTSIIGNGSGNSVARLRVSVIEQGITSFTNFNS